MGNDLLGLKVLLSTSAKPGYVPDFSPAGNQIVCGPRRESLQIEDRVVSIQTKSAYDLGDLAHRLPANQKPDLVIVRTDSFWLNVPRNLRAVSCPRVLLFGDTHHGEEPLRKLLAYLEAEPFDHIVLLYDGHHAHWLAAAGHRNVLFMPGLDVQHLGLPFREQRIPEIVFIGQTGRFHPRRTNLLAELTGRGYPLRAQLAGREESSRLYGESLITFNCSLNGDFNMRVFEALEAGAFLLTDRLAPQAGLSERFEDGRHLVCYDSPGDLADKAGYYLAHPDEALAIARTGYEHCREHFHPAVLASDLLAIVHGDTTRAGRYRSGNDGRNRLPATARPVLQSRLAVYEHLQDVHRQREVVKLLGIGAIETVCDLVDLPRLRAFLVEEAATERELAHAQSVGAGEQLWLVALDDAATGDWDTIVIGSDRIGDWLERALAALRFRRLVVADWNPDHHPGVAGRLAAHGYHPVAAGNGIFERPGLSQTVIGAAENGVAQP